MNSMTKQEYLDLINKLLDQQYENDEPETPDPDSHWMPAESPLKDKIPISVQNGVIDLTNAKKDKIKTSLTMAGGFRVDNFLVKVKRRQTNSLPVALVWDIELFEERFKTPSGNPCRMTYRLDVGSDTRFNQCPWVTSFGKGSSARGVSPDVFFDIIRWMQAIKRMTAFL